MLTECRHRVVIKDSSYFFCRNARVHTSLNLVTSKLCGLCSRTDDLGDRQRPVPAQVEELAPRSWKYFRTRDLVADTVRLAGQLGGAIDGVVGLARSGLIPAATLATGLHLPLWSWSRQSGLVDLGGGGRFERAGRQVAHVAIVDDSVFGGVAMSAALPFIKQAFPRAAITRVAVYVRPQAAGAVDLYAQVVPAPHLFEWNLFNCQQANSIAVDFDGVLCADWEGDEEASPERYHQHLHSALPKHLPRRSPVPLVVTARLERYRPATEGWLTRHGVYVSRLVMGPWANAAERRRSYSAAGFKGQAYKDSSCRLFVESCPVQAREIFEVSRKPVLALETGEVWQP